MTMKKEGGKMAASSRMRIRSGGDFSTSTRAVVFQVRPHAARSGSLQGGTPASPHLEIFGS